MDACDWGGLALGPFDLTGKRAEPSAFVARPELCARVPFDLDGDGAGDFEDIVDRQWVIRAGGAAAGEGAAPVLAVLPAEAHGHVYFFEEGVAAVLYLLPPEDRAAVVAATADLGPATPRGLLE